MKASYRHLPHALLAIAACLSHNASVSGRPALVKNTWRGITPLRSTAADVARVLGVDPDSFNLNSGNTFRVEDGEVTVSFISAKLARIYRAPNSLVGKVFTIYFRPDQRPALADLKLPRAFRRCSDQLSKSSYYFVSDHGVAYQFTGGSDLVEFIIYQPVLSEIRRLSVSTDCVF